MGPDLALPHPSARLPRSWPRAPSHKLGFSGTNSQGPCSVQLGPAAPGLAPHPVSGRRRPAPFYSRERPAEVFSELKGTAGKKKKSVK